MMANFFSTGSLLQSESVFKIPQLPARIRKPNCNNTQSTYNHGVGIPNITETHKTLFDELQEKLVILRELFPAEDRIWQDMINTVNHLCFVKLSEQVFQPNSQGCTVLNFQPNSQAGSVVNFQSNNQACSDVNYVVNDISYEPKGNATRNSRQRRNFPVADENELLEGTTTGLYVPRVNDLPVSPIRRTPASPVRRKPASPVRRKATSPVRRKATSPVRRTPASPTRRSSKGRSIKVNNSKESIKENVPVARELNVLPSEDESDSLTAFFQKRRRPATKTSTAAVSAKTALRERVAKGRMSISLERVDSEDETLTSAKRKRSSSGSTRSVKRQPVASEEGATRPDSTVAEPPKVTKKRLRPLPSKPASNSAASTDAARNCLVSSTKPEAAVKRNPKKLPPKTSVKLSSQQVVLQPSTSNALNDEKASPACGFRQLDDDSFFGDVSSIDGISSCAVLDPARRRTNKNQDDDGNDAALLIFDQFENVRSTSCFSAMSTPLSKSTAKNTLSKRLKKPSVAAELKDQLKPARKPRKVALKANIQQLDNTAGTTESDCVVSDFSDDE